MTSVVDLWQRIEAEGRTESGWHVRRIETGAVCEISAGIHQPDQTPGLLLELSVDDVPGDVTFPRSTGFLVEPVRLPGTPSRIRFVLSLADPRFRAIFGVLNDDVVGAAAAAPSPRHALRAWAFRLHAWQAFMARHGADGLSETAALGLLGELLVLRDDLAPRCGLAAALGMWRGPSGEPNDFTLPGGFLEIKTTCRQAPELLEITSLDQLDDARGHIVLAHVRLLQTSAGETLPAVIETIRDRIIREAPHQLGELNTRLLEAGYVPLHADRYTLACRRDRIELFNVRDGFPRIARSSLQPGIRRGSYAIELTACTDYRVPESVLDDLVAEGVHA